MAGILAWTACREQPAPRVARARPARALRHAARPGKIALLLLTSDKSSVILSGVYKSHQSEGAAVDGAARRSRLVQRRAWVPKSRIDLLQGTLDMLILKTLALGPMHGWGISQRIAQISEAVLQVNQGSLYPALQRLETAGYVDSEWGASDNNRQARFYRLTKKGQKQLRDEKVLWERMAAAVARILAAES